MQPSFVQAVVGGLAKAVPLMDLLTVRGYKRFRKQVDVFTRQCVRRGTETARSW